MTNGQFAQSRASLFRAHRTNLDRNSFSKKRSIQRFVSRKRSDGCDEDDDVFETVECAVFRNFKNEPKARGGTEEEGDGDRSSLFGEYAEDIRDMLVSCGYRTLLKRKTMERETTGGAKLRMADDVVLVCAFGIAKRIGKDGRKGKKLIGLGILETDQSTVAIIDYIYVDLSKCRSEIERAFAESVKKFMIQSACEKLWNEDKICDIGARVCADEVTLYKNCEFDFERDGAVYQRLIIKDEDSLKSSLVFQVNEHKLKEILLLEY